MHLLLRRVRNRSSKFGQGIWWAKGFVSNVYYHGFDELIDEWRLYRFLIFHTIFCDGVVCFWYGIRSLCFSQVLLFCLDICSFCVIQIRVFWILILCLIIYIIKFTLITCWECRIGRFKLVDFLFLFVLFHLQCHLSVQSRLRGNGVTLDRYIICLGQRFLLGMCTSKSWSVSTAGVGFLFVRQGYWRYIWMFHGTEACVWCVLDFLLMDSAALCGWNGYSVYFDMFGGRVGFLCDYLYPFELLFGIVTNCSLYRLRLFFGFDCSSMSTNHVT